MTRVPVPASRVVLPWGGLALILLVTVAAYRGVVENGFVLDDQDTVQGNPAVQSLTSVDRWFLSPHAGSARRESPNYRPILVASYALDRAFWGPQAAGFHRTNLVMHLGTVLLVFVLGRRLWGEAADVAALWAAGLVALHPINAEAVNYITARSSLLTAFFTLAAVWAYDEAVVRGSRVWLLPGFGLGLLALGSKESAAMLPILILAWDRARAHRIEPWRRTLVRSMPWWGLTGAFLLWRAMVMRDAASASIAPSAGSVDQNVLFAIKIYLVSFWSWLWPVRLAVDHGWPIAIEMSEGIVLVIGAVAAVGGTVALVARYRQPGWCLVWFWMAMLPMGALPFISRTTLYQDNRTYLAGIGLAWGVGWVVAHAARRWIEAPCRKLQGTFEVQGSKEVRFPSRAHSPQQAAGNARAMHFLSRGARFGAAVLGIGVVLAASYGDAARTAVWRDSARLWDDVITKYPGSVLGHNTRGIRLLNAGRIDEAGHAFERSNRLAPNYSHTHYYLGLVQGRRGEWERAMTEFQIALTINPRYTNARLALGDAYERLGRPAQALDVYETFLRDDPEVIDALRRSGILLERQGRYEEAADRYRRVLAIDPTDDQVRFALGAVLKSALGADTEKEPPGDAERPRR